MGFAKMDLGVEFDAEYDGANRFVENFGQVNEQEINK